MERTSFSASLLGALLLGGLLLPGCAEPDQAAPPVMDVLSDMNDIDLAKRADEAARRQQALDAINNAATQKPDVPTEGIYVVEFETTAGSFKIEVHRDWAPYGADRFYKLVKDNYYEDAAFFRVMKGFMVQWGLAARPGMTRKWNMPIPDDPVFRSNTRGYVSFAQTNSPHSRTGQVFVNYVDNSNLDTTGQGFAPFGKVIEGMETVDAINGKHGQNPDQGQIRSRGNAYLREQFPGLDYIKSATIVVDDMPEGDEDEAEQSETESSEANAEPAAASTEEAADEEAAAK